MTCVNFYFFVSMHERLAPGSVPGGSVCSRGALSPLVRRRLHRVQRWAVMSRTRVNAALVLLLSCWVTDVQPCSPVQPRRPGFITCAYARSLLLRDAVKLVSRLHVDAGLWTVAAAGVWGGERGAGQGKGLTSSEPDGLQ